MVTGDGEADLQERMKLVSRVMGKCGVGVHGN